MSDFDCQSCGACCVEAGPVGITSDDRVPDYLIVPNSRQPLRTDDPKQVIAKHMGGRCKALEGTLGHCVSCSIYEKRPMVCSTFEKGSEGCLAAREIMLHRMSRLDWKPRGYGDNWRETV